MDLKTSLRDILPISESRSVAIPELIRPSQPEPSGAQETAAKHLVTPRERKLYAVLTLVLGLNTVLLFGALTFFALALHR